jgi:hypothetical protein
MSYRPSLLALKHRRFPSADHPGSRSCAAVPTTVRWLVPSADMSSTSRVP